MKICVIHISDIHIRENNVALVNDAGKLASSCLPDFRSSELCLIAVTGDIAYSGKKSEYEIARSFFDKVIEGLRYEKNIPIKVVMAPGNHDCFLLPENTIRSSLIEVIRSDNKKAEDESFVDICVSAQKDFFEFRDSLGEKDKYYSDALWDELEIDCGSKKVRVSLINASWMSTIHEQPGSLVFPIHKYKEILSQDVDHRIMLIHHPMNWYCQDTYHDFRRAIQQSSNIVLSGHEHISLTSDVKTTSDSGNTIYYEGISLSPHEENSQAGFSTLLIDLENDSVLSKVYKKAGLGYEEDESSVTSNSLVEKKSSNSITDEFLLELKDPGANFTLPDKGRVDMSDIYVSPELEFIGPKKTVNFDALDLVGRKLYITGDEQTGKTKILHNSFLKLHGQGVCPIYLDARNVKRCTKDGIKKAVEKSAKKQYGDGSSEVNSAARINRAILIDNYEEIGGMAKGLDSVFEYVEENFGTVLIACNDIFSATVASSRGQSSSLASYDVYRVKDFGCNLRYQLIKKWHSHQYGQSTLDFEKKVHNSEKTITTVLGRNLIPSRPLYLLTLLQSSSSQSKEELNNSGMSYYYQYLITKSLGEAGVGRASFDEMFNYISNLAWFFRSQGVESLDEEELYRFNEGFSKKYSTIRFDRQISILLRSKILMSNDVSYSFSYPYIKYFFLGKYFADHIDDSEINFIIQQCCEDLSTRENSNLVLFLTHHKNSEWVVDSISENLSKCFGAYDPLEFGDDTSCFSDLVGSISEIVVSDLNVEHNQKVQRELKEDAGYEPSDEQLTKSSDSYSETLSDLFKLVRSSEVLGQILKNYYGSITRDKKSSYIEEAMNAPLRLLGFVATEIMKDPDNMVSQIEVRLKDMDETLTNSQVKDLATMFMSEFISSLCTGLVAKTAENIGSDKLKEDISAVVVENGSNSFNLVQAAISLVSPNRLPIEKLKRLSRMLEHNPLAFKVLQNLALYHIHMFHTPDKEKKALGALTKINLKGLQGPVGIG